MEAVICLRLFRLNQVRYKIITIAIASVASRDIMLCCGGKNSWHSQMHWRNGSIILTACAAFLLLSWIYLHRRCLGSVHRFLTHTCTLLYGICCDNRRLLGPFGKGCFSVGGKHNPSVLCSTAYVFDAPLYCRARRWPQSACC